MTTRCFKKAITIKNSWVKVVLLLAFLANSQVFSQQTNENSKSPPKLFEEVGAFDADEDELEKMDDTSLSYLVTASLFAQENNYRKAIETITEALRRDPKFVSGYLNRSYWYFKTGQFDLAIEDCTKIIKLGKKLANTYQNRGLLFLFKKNYKRAVKDASKAIVLDPKNVNAYRIRAQAYRELGKTRQAEADAKMAEKLRQK